MRCIDVTLCVTFLAEGSEVSEIQKGQRYTAPSRENVYFGGGGGLEEIFGGNRDFIRGSRSSSLAVLFSVLERKKEDARRIFSFFVCVFNNCISRESPLHCCIPRKRATARVDITSACLSVCLSVRSFVHAFACGE